MSQTKQTGYWNGFLLDVEFVHGGRNNEHRKRYYDKEKRTRIDSAGFGR